VVLEKLEPIEREVTTLKDGRSFIMRVLPYRTTDGRIDGVVVTLIDITERKRMEEAHARLAAIVESSDDAIIAKNLNGTILSWNTGSERLFGYRADEVIGKPITLLLPPELQLEEEQILRRLSEGERIKHFETVRLTKDGRQVEVSVTASPIMDSQGRIIGASKIARDITLRKQAEESLRRAKEEWERTFASVPDLITILDNDHRVLRVNNAMARRLGLKPEECVGLPCYEAVHGTSVPYEFCPHSRTIKNGREHIEEVHEEQLGGDFLVTTTPLHDEQGLMIGSVHVARDITERKRAEETLRGQAVLLNLAYDAIIVLGTGDKVVFWNRGAEETYGWTPEEAMGQVTHDLLKTRFPKPLAEIAEDVSKKGRWEGELTHTRKDGQVIVVASRWAVQRDLSGCQVGVLEINRDITERKRAEEAFETARLEAIQEKIRLEAVMEALPVGVAILDALGGHIRTNRMFDKVWGDVRPLPRPIDDHAAYKAWWIETGQPVQPEEWASVRAVRNDESLVGQLLRIERFDGGQAYIHNSAAPFHDPDGQIAGCVVAIMDITDQIEAEEELRTSYQRTDLMAEATAQLLASDSPQGVVDKLCRRVMEVLDCQAFFNFLVDEKAGQLRLNACAGIPEEEVKKLEWLDYGIAVCGCAARDATRIVAEDIPNTPDPRTELVKSYGIQAYACHPLLAQGRVLGTLSFGTRNRPGFTEAELALMKTVADHVAIAMERKFAEENLKLAREAADAASRAKSQFLANMSHELRTPMTGVLGMLEFTLDGPLEVQQRDFIETANKSARTLLRILNDILDLAKVEAGKFSIEEKPFVLRDCVSGAIDILVPEARRKSLELNCKVADDLPKTVVGDQVRLLQILTNLLGNAVKYTERGEVKITVTSGPRTPAGKRAINFIIEDSGIGIPANKHEMIFQSFTQADESHTRAYGGTGLGLAISKELVERMGGTISCVSEEGVGSTFSFTLPFAEERVKDETAAKPVTAAPPISAHPLTEEFRRARLLFAEDDPITRQVIRMMLQRSNFDLDIAENGLQAVELWEQGNYDLVLMDVQMPLMDGFAATGAIREKERANGGHTLIVAMTAHAFPEDEKRCLAAGMDAYIPKPINMKECISMITNLIKNQDLESL
jgi:PAS domain S-box-containing protein